MSRTAKPLAKFSGAVTLFGCGTMAGAMLRRWLVCGLALAQVTALRRTPTTIAPQLEAQKADASAPPADIFIIGVKPQGYAAARAAMANYIGPSTVVCSIMAGITLDQLEQDWPHAAARVRLMPNLPVETGDGIIAVVGEGAPLDKRLAVLLAPLGHVQTVDSERDFDAVTALAGCGPAFVYRFVAAMAGAGERLGLPEVDAEKLARLTLIGAARTLASDQRSAGELAAAVASPGGMTQAGLDRLDEEGALTQLLSETLRAARDRGTEMASLAHG